MALTLRAAITATQTSFEISGADDLAAGALRTIGSEIVQIRNANRGVAPGESGYWRVSADRGVLGTTAAAHDAATAVTATTIGGEAAELDADLTAIGALTSAANKVPYATGAGTWALADFSAAGRALVDDANAAAQRTTLGVGPAPDFATATNAIATDESTTSGSFEDLTTPGPSVTVTIGATGKAELVLTADIINETAGNASYLAMVISGASTVAAAQMLVDRNGTAYTSTRTRTVIITGLTPGETTFKMQYAAGGGTAAHFSNRSLIVKPVL